MGFLSTEVIIFLFPFLLTLFLLLKKSNKEVNQVPPSPPRLPILGNLLQFGSLTHRSLWQLSRKYGPVMLLHLGRIPVLIVSSAEAAREILKVNDISCCSRLQKASTGKLTYNYLDIGFAPYGEHWKEIRKLCVIELFSTKRVKSFWFIRDEEIDSLINSISESSSSSTPLDITAKIYSFTGSVAFKTAFGTCFRGSKFDSDKFYELVDQTQIVLGRISAEEFFPGVGWIWDRINGHNQRLERVFHALDTFYEEVIDDHLKPGRTSTKQHDDIVDVMLGIIKEQTEDGHAWLTKNHIKAVLLDIFVAGVDTSAITVNWAMAELIRKPSLMKKAQEEIRSIVGKKGRVTEEDLDQLEYLKLVIKETLRLHPPIPLLVPRETMSPFKLNDYTINPKTVIIINGWAIARDPKYWENPEEFRPERFIDSAVDFRGQHFEYLPFGAGRRVCPGMYMAEVTTQLLLANLLNCFDWKLPNGMREEDVNMQEEDGHSIANPKKDPLFLVPSKYNLSGI